MPIIEVDTAAHAENGNSIAEQAAHQLITGIKSPRPHAGFSDIVVSNAHLRPLAHIHANEG